MCFVSKQSGYQFLTVRSPVLLFLATYSMCVWPKEDAPRRADTAAAVAQVPPRTAVPRRWEQRSRPPRTDDPVCP